MRNLPVYAGSFRFAEGSFFSVVKNDYAQEFWCTCDLARRIADRASRLLEGLVCLHDGK